MKTLDQRLAELAAWASDEADSLNDCFLNEGPFKGIHKGADGEWWAIFETEESRIQSILDLAKLLGREKQI